MKNTCVVFTLSALIVVAAVCVLAGPETATKAKAPKNSGDVVSLSVRGAAPTTASGESFKMTVTMEIARKWHLYAHEDTAFYGIELKLPEKHVLQNIRIDYPEGEKAEFFGQQVLILHGSRSIHLHATVPEGLEPGVYDVPLTLAVQACDHASCLAPAFLPVSLTVNVPVRF